MASGVRKTLELDNPSTTVLVGNCGEVLRWLKSHAAGRFDLIFADPPFNWGREYDVWDDSMGEEQYLKFTRDWIDACIPLLSESGSFWVNIPDEWVAFVYTHLKRRGLHPVNWNIWHYRFGQCTDAKFIRSKVHALYFCVDPKRRIWDPSGVIEASDRSAIYADDRTKTRKSRMPPGMRVPFDVWYGPNLGRIQGNNAERRAGHDNQLPELYMHRVISSCTRESSLVLDPFLGSGTTLTVARAMGRASMGVEISEDMAESAFKRIMSGAVRIQRRVVLGKVVPVFVGSNDKGFDEGEGG